MIKSTVKIVLNGKPLSNGKSSVYLRIIKDRKKKHIGLGLQCRKEHFNNESFTKKHPNHQVENEILLKLKQRALKIIREFQVKQEDFTLQEFEKAFRGVEDECQYTVLEFFNEIIEEMKRAGRISQATVVKETRNSIFRFAEDSLKFEEITSTFLEKYEVFLRETGSKNGGIAFRMRELRTIFNKARKRGIIPKEPYPFEKYCISKLKSESTKTALSLEEFQKFKAVDLSMYPHLQEAYNYFLFSIYTRGMNFQDMMLLKWNDIRNGRIFYIRSKTKGKINLEIIPPAQEILDYYKAQKRDTKYVFPILLSDTMTPQQIANRKQKVLSRYNSKLKTIARLAGIHRPISSYVARHSFATILKMSGAPIEKISEMMGHRDVSITIAYLKDFSDEDLDKENRVFMNL